MIATRVSLTHCRRSSRFVRKVHRTQLTGRLAWTMVVGIKLSDFSLSLEEVELVEKILSSIGLELG